MRPTVDEPMGRVTGVKPLALGPSEAEALGLNPLPGLSASPCEGPQMLTSKCALYRFSRHKLKENDMTEKVPGCSSRDRASRVSSAGSPLNSRRGFCLAPSSVLITAFCALDSNSPVCHRSRKAAGATKGNDPNSRRGRCLCIENRVQKSVYHPSSKIL